jgi:hypothetical protein
MKNANNLHCPQKNSTVTFENNKNSPLYKHGNHVRNKFYPWLLKVGLYMGWANPIFSVNRVGNKSSQT